MRDPSRITRREFLGVASMGAGALVTGCLESSPLRSQNIDGITLTARPGTPTETATPGLTPLGLDPQTDGFLYVPANYQPTTAAPLLALMHRAGGTASEWFTDSLKSFYDELGFIVVAPDSRGFSWDLLETGLYGRDVEFLDAALAQTFRRCNVDSTRIGIGGFSDGASEALGLGIANGDFISKVVAFSPSRLFGPFRRGEPSFFLSHGSEDAAVPITIVRDTIVPTLRAVFPDVTFVEFQGVHEMPDSIARQGFEWFVAL